MSECTVVEFLELEWGLGDGVLGLRHGLGVLGFLSEYDVNRDIGHSKISSESAKAGSGETRYPSETGQGWVLLEACRV